VLKEENKFHTQREENNNKETKGREKKPNQKKCFDVEVVD